ncbi:MAG: CDP-glycerol glycerophosphotransferase family protein [Shewanella sp.]|uniref:CDP-glycerol glycerophosphotransferase family protein n=1 Tax=Shewanella sp. TaxID=50422 RepID=UPI003001165E
MNLSNTHCYIAPANPAGRRLMEQCLHKRINILGLVDNMKSGEGITSPSSVSATEKIIIAYGGFQQIVAEELLKRGLNSSQLLVESDNGDITPYKRTLITQFRQFSLACQVAVIHTLRKLPYRGQRVYYAEGFADANILTVYQQDLKSNQNVVLIVDKPDASPTDIKSINFKQKPINCFLKMVFARSYIVDHEYASLIFSILRTSVPVIQLWHGLPYKHLSGNKHYPNVNDHSFISSSQWFNENVFKAIFQCQHFYDFGYPRNDVFFQTLEQRSWINSESLEALKNVVEKTGELIFYAPTYRDNQNNNYPIDFAKLNQWCINHNKSFIVKFHPFIYRTIVENMGIAQEGNIISLPDYEHIYLYPNGKNAYAWLADAEMLITDYSSIAFDFLLTHKPIIYFQYDKQEYTQVRGKQLISDEIFIQGPQVDNFNSLLNTMTELVNAQVDLSQQQSCRDYNLHSQRKACTPDILKIIDKAENDAN